MNEEASSPLGESEVAVVEEAMTEAERCELLEWIERGFERGAFVANPQDARLFSTPFRLCDGTPTPLSTHHSAEVVWAPTREGVFEAPFPRTFWTVRSRAIRALFLEELPEDPYKGSFVSYMLPGGRVHEHRDGRIQGAAGRAAILRCNVFVSKPQHGGAPVIEGVEVDVPERGMWAFFPTELTHSATLVSGTIRRATLSFGFIVDPQLLWQRRFRVRDAVSWHGEEWGRHRPVKELLDVIRAQTGWFSVLQAAERSGQPPEFAGRVLCELQRQHVVEPRRPRGMDGLRILTP